MLRDKKATPMQRCISYFMEITYSIMRSPMVVRMKKNQKLSSNKRPDESLRRYAFDFNVNGNVLKESRKYENKILTSYHLLLLFLFPGELVARRCKFRRKHTNEMTLRSWHAEAFTRDKRRNHFQNYAAGRRRANQPEKEKNFTVPTLLIDMSNKARNFYTRRKSH